jgi:hypothetical protein
LFLKQVEYYDWGLPKVEEDLQDARRSLQDEKQSNEEKDGHIQLITDQKKQHIQSISRLKKEANAAKVKADQRELGLDDQILLLKSKSSTEMQLKTEAENRVGTLQRKVTTLQGEATNLLDRANAEMKSKAEAETRVET